MQERIATDLSSFEEELELLLSTIGLGVVAFEITLGKPLSNMIAKIKIETVNKKSKKWPKGL